MGWIKACLALICAMTMCQGQTIEQTLPVAPVWSGHPVGFCLLTAVPHQYVAFYDARRRMTIASRQLPDQEWTFKTLDETIGWDSHNYITMTVDGQGHLHVSGNMHCVPLVYFRTERPHDIGSLKRIKVMVGREEKRCTYPRFLRGAADELIFTYRDGGSGNGNQIYNVYDPAKRTWRRLLDRPLCSGQGKMNAYLRGPVQDAAGMFHLCWVWRDTPDCATNHDLSYARSRDLVHWTTSAGKPLTLPITLATGEVVDPVPPGGGMINGNTVIGFDRSQRPIVSYHKYDAAGRTQIYNARLEKGRWVIYQASDWTYRWAFQGNGSIGFEIGVGAVKVDAQGRLVQSYSHVRHGSGLWVLDEKTLKSVGKLPRPVKYPSSLRKVTSTRKGMSVRFAGDSGKSSTPGKRYCLRWETLGRNRDRPHPGEPPVPSRLVLFCISSDG